MLKILINAYACSPTRGSEPGMGWNFIVHIAKYHKVVVITEAFEFKDELTNYQKSNPNLFDNITFYFIPKKNHDILRKIWPPSYYWFYRNWQRKAYRLALKLNKEMSFDIVHQLNMVGYREPGYLWKLDKPFVWGPIGGMNITPWCMLSSMGGYGAVFYFFRNLINLFQMHLGRRPRKCAKRADAVITATMDNYRMVKKQWNIDSVIIPEVGSFTDSAYIKRRQKDEPFKICWSGEHTPGKSLNILISSISNITLDYNIELNVIGKGQKTKSWKNLAKRKNLNCIVWHGWVKKQTAIEIMRECHVFCITSLSDLTSTVLLEALSLGKPVIALDHCGFSFVITDKCGIRIPIFSQKQVIQDFAEAIKDLYLDEDRRIDLAKGAFERSKTFSWEDKMVTLNNIYNQVLIRHV